MGDGGHAWRLPENVLPKLVERLPELNELYLEHLRFHEEEIPYIFIADVCRWIEALYAVPDADDTAVTHREDATRRLLAFLEEAATSPDPFLYGWVAAGFVEAMNPDLPSFATLVWGMGPTTRRAAKNWFPNECRALGLPSDPPGTRQSE